MNLRNLRPFGDADFDDYLRSIAIGGALAVQSALATVKKSVGVASVVLDPA
jgi:hypothetical protein